MISDKTYDIIQSIAKEYVPNKTHAQLHVNSMEAWTGLVVELVDKGVVKPKASEIMKCAKGWESLLTFKLSRLN